MTIPNSITIPCAVNRRDALIAYRGFFNPQAVHLRFVTDGHVHDYVDDRPFPGDALPRRPVYARSLVDFLDGMRPTETMVQIDRDLDGRWRDERATLVYHVGIPHDLAAVILTREDAARLAEWVREAAGLPERPSRRSFTRNSEDMIP